MLEELVEGDVYAQLGRLAELADGEGLTVAQLSLAYLLQLSAMGPLIPSASNVTQLEENARAGTVELPESVLEQLREIFI